jgi:hypothetical protein
VSGVLALMLGINPRSRLPTSTTAERAPITENIGSSQFFGNGLIDAARAVNARGGAAAARTIVDPVLRDRPRRLNFGLPPASCTSSASNGGNDQQPLT